MAIEGYDLVMIGLLAAAAVLGYFKGIVWQLAWIAGIAASSWVAIRFGGPLAPFFGQQAPWNKLIAMLALYLATSLAVWLLFRIVAGFIDAIHLSAFDHQLGLLLGLAKGVLLCVVVTFFAITLAPGYRGQIVASRSGRLVAELIVRADQFLPREVIEAVDPFVRQFREQLAQPGGPGLATTQPTGGTTPARSFFDAVTSAAAWTGTEPSGQGTQQAAGQPAAQPATRAAWSQPAAPPHPASTAAPPAFPQQQSWPAATQRVQAPQQPVQQPAPPQPPARFPVGPQSPLPIR
jgi:membrane protein required for colicin V production